MKTKTTLVIAALAVVLGVAFATWTEEAHININAATGYIDLDFTSVSKTACSPYMDCTAGTPTNSAPGNDGEPSVTLTLSNAYPGATATFTIEVKNDGTIPVDVSCSVSGDSQLTVTLSETNFSIDEGDSYTLVVDISVATSGVDEEATYSATVTCTYTQAVPSS